MPAVAVVSWRGLLNLGVSLVFAGFANTATMHLRQVEACSLVKLTPHLHILEDLSLAMPHHPMLRNTDRIAIYFIAKD